MKISCYAKQDSFTLTINDLVIQNGITGLVGKNGSGKTTLLKAISREIYAKVTIKDFIGTSMYVSQNPYMFKGTVFDNIAMPLKFASFNHIDIQVNKVMNQLEIDDLRDKYAKNLSSGERLKVALARALVMKPDLLLIDEVTANVDILSKKWIYKILNSLKKDVKIIFATHDIIDIKNCVDNLVYLENGQVAYSGKIDYDIDFLRAYREIGSEFDV